MPAHLLIQLDQRQCGFKQRKPKANALAAPVRQEGTGDDLLSFWRARHEALGLECLGVTPVSLVPVHAVDADLHRALLGRLETMFCHGLGAVHIHAAEPTCTAVPSGMA